MSSILFLKRLDDSLRIQGLTIPGKEPVLISYLSCVAFFYMTMWLYSRLAKVITNNVKIYLFNINPSGLQWLFISWVGAFLVLALSTR